MMQASMEPLMGSGYQESNWTGVYPITIIGYDILERSQIKLVIYDVLGRQVEELVDGEKCLVVANHIGCARSAERSLLLRT